MSDAGLGLLQPSDQASDRRHVVAPLELVPRHQNQDLHFKSDQPKDHDASSQSLKDCQSGPSTWSTVATGEA